MKLLKPLSFLVFISISFLFFFNSTKAYGIINNRNVYVGFFYSKNKINTADAINNSFKKVLSSYFKSKKPYFVFAYSDLKTIPPFNFNKNINIVRIKELAIRFHSGYIVTGGISRFGSHFDLHAMFINIKDIYNAKTYDYSGSGKESFNKKVQAFALKVSSFISEGIKSSRTKKTVPLSKRIYSIRVKGNIRVGTGVILDNIKVEKGGIYTASGVNASIKELYKTGYFDNISVYAASSPKGTIVTFAVSERPLIKYIKYSGNGSVSVKKIKEIITLSKGSPYSAFKVHDAVNALKYIYSAEGYYNAKVKVEAKKYPGNYIGINFVIDENSPVLVKSVKFEGNAAFQSSKLASIMGIKTVGILSWITGSGKFKKAQLNNQIIKLLSFYYNNGYINVSVGEPKFVFSKNKKYVTIIIKIDEGPQYRISKVDLDIKNLGKGSKEYKDAKKLIITRVGDIFNRKSIEKEILSITKYFTEKGYAFADVEPSIKMEQKTSSVRIKLTVRRGSIARFGRISITGNTVTYSYVILRALTFTPGERYNPSLIKSSRQKIKNLMYFKHVAITTEKVPDKSVLNVNIHVQEQNTGKFTIGGGYSSATSFMAITSISESNLFGTGIKASLNVQAGGPYQSYSFNILQPYLTYIFARPLSLNVSMFDTFNSLYYEFAYRSVGGSVTLGYPIYKNILTEYFRYLLEQDSAVVIEGLNNILPSGKLLTSEVSFTTVYNTLNNPIMPTSGDMDSFRISFAGPPFGGNDDFVKYVIQGTHYIPLWDGTSFMQGVQAGYITSTNASNPLPIYERFFVGGITNVYPLLGFMYDSVGPTQNGLLVGGTKMFTVQAKYLVPLVPNMKFYGFLWWNAGNAWSQDASLFPINLVQAAGVGFDWYSPFGPITITYGKILGTPINGNNPTRIQFSLGEGFPGI